MLEVQRFLYLIFPYVFCTTISALIIWNEDWRKNGKQLLIYSVLAGITQTMSYQINNEAIRFPLEIVSGFLWMWIVFRRSFPWVAKIFTTSYVTGIPMVILSLIFCSYILGLTPSEVINNSRMWLGVTLPIFVLGTICIALVKRLWARKWNMTSFENIQGWAVVASAASSIGGQHGLNLVPVSGQGKQLLVYHGQYRHHRHIYYKPSHYGDLYEISAQTSYNLHSRCCIGKCFGTVEHA
ncbi:hypothetical protein [Syntrophomonas palmitatica]|uniref:hypothetical protein n=1 Tax=Syntrophomonas palmitatica TaxID=402877 RepID=UPI0006D0E419|nr:hypothetical protein [Syntrophomonas palmitatica]